MDIAALSMALSQSNVRQQANLSLMDKAMEQADTSSQGMVKMMEDSSVKAMEQSITPHKGGSIDLRG